MRIIQSSNCLNHDERIYGLHDYISVSALKNQSMSMMTRWVMAAVASTPLSYRTGSLFLVLPVYDYDYDF